MCKRLKGALVALGFFVGASAAAQSSVTLYGVIDIGVGGNQQRYKHSSVGMVSGLESGSRWGLRGQEQLGNGWIAGFQLESGFDPATGDKLQGNRLFGRAAWVSLASELGEVRLGRQVTASSDYFVFIDPFGSGFGQAGIGSSFNGTSTNRVDNTITYLSPIWAGAQFVGSYTFNRDGGVAARSDSAQLLSAVALYDRGPFSLAASYEAAYLGRNTTWAAWMRASDPQGKSYDPYNVQVGGTWDFGRFTAAAAWSYMKHGYTNPDMGDDFGSAGVAVDAGTLRVFPRGHVNAYFVGLTAQLTPQAKLFATWQMSDPSREVVRFGSTHSQQIYSLGATYTLSSRTNLYAYYSYADQAWFDPRWRSQSYAVGIRHLF